MVEVLHKRLMELTEIRIRLLTRTMDKLRGCASITIGDSLVVRDIKIIEGENGLFVAMPSRKVCDRCRACSAKTPLRARYCGHCGCRLPDGRGSHNPKVRLHADIAHPIHRKAREFIEQAILAAFHDEVERSEQVGYQPQPFETVDFEGPLASPGEPAS